MKRIFRHFYQGEHVTLSDPEYQENKSTFDYLKRRVEQIEKESGRQQFFRGDSLMDETKTFEIRIFA